MIDEISLKTDNLYNKLDKTVLQVEKLNLEVKYSEEYIRLREFDENNLLNI